MKNEMTRYVMLLLMLLAPGAWALPPLAGDDGPIVLDEDTVVSFDVLGNDIDPEGDSPLFVASFNPVPANGVLTPAPPFYGDVTYTPDVGFSGENTFRYKSADCPALGPCLPLSNFATVTLQVLPVADAPSLTASDVSGLEDTPVALSIASALDSVGDPDGSESLVI